MRLNKHQRNIDHHQPFEKTARSDGQLGKRDQARGQEEVDEQARSDDHVHGGSHQRDPQFLDRLFGHSFQPSHAANRINCDVAGFDPILAGGKGMSIFVQDHTREKHEDEENPAKHLAPVLIFQPVTVADPPDEKQEGGVNVNVNTCKFS